MPDLCLFDGLQGARTTRLLNEKGSSLDLGSSTLWEPQAAGHRAETGAPERKLRGHEVTWSCVAGRKHWDQGAEG